MSKRGERQLAQIGKSTVKYDQCYYEMDEMIDALNHPWPAPSHAAVARRITLGIGHIEVTLDPDGTYFLTDISG